jgi:anaerobic magnesium-protoporphyrin IX monomethyl ester cyclase
VQFKSNKILLFNPRSGKSKHRLPISILQIAASVSNKYDTVIIDANLESNAYDKIDQYLKTSEFKYFGCTVMPGPQLKQAIPFTQKVKQKYPEIITIWGGYFPSNHYEVVMKSSIVDYIIYGQGDIAFPRLIDCLEKGNIHERKNIENLIFLDERREIVKNSAHCITDLDSLPNLPYDLLSKYYPLQQYIAKTFMGSRTYSYHSSFGCPYRCSFCGVVNMFDSKWKAKSAKKMFEEIMFFKSKYDIDAIEFHDNNFFASHERVIDFCMNMQGLNIRWWAEGRVDALNKFTDSELQLLREAGCCMIFMGAESCSDEVLQQINKSGSQKGGDTKLLAGRLKSFGIIPEFSFVLGFPCENKSKMKDQIKKEMRFIRELKKINPLTEIIIYIYSPVPATESSLYKTSVNKGFQFPGLLTDWLKPGWENFDLRKNPLTPWLTPSIIRTIKNFETVLNAAFPSVSDFQIRGLRKIILMLPARFRYRVHFYSLPLELKILLKLFHYRQAEQEGFYSE